jgi:hypothetical protein
MWELYGVLMLIPIIFAHYLQTGSPAQVSWLSFAASEPAPWVVRSAD